MRAFSYEPVGTRRCLRLVPVGLTTIALVLNACLPMSFASPSHAAGLHAGINREALSASAMAGMKRSAVDTLARSAVRFEACSESGHAQFLARMKDTTVYVSADEATFLLQTEESVGRLGRVADLGSPRNARSPQANEQLPEPRRDRAAPRLASAATVRMQLVGANHRASVTGEDQLPAKTNYFIGVDASRWRTGVASFGRVRVEQAYRGVDVVYYGSGEELEYDFEVAPGATYKAIALRLLGAERIEIDESGDLVIDTLAGRIRQHKPVAYQLIGGERREIPARYIVRRNREIGFDIGVYDRAKQLVIDPVLSYSTLFGGLSSDSIYAVAVDAQGNAYVAGTTESNDLPITPGAFQPNGPVRSGATFGFVAKVDLTNNQILYSTYIGGAGQTSGVPENQCFAIAIDAAGNAYVTGETRAADFPTTANAFQRTLAGGSDSFVAKLNPAGNALVYSTYLGSSKNPVSFFSAGDEGHGIAVDVFGNAYVTGLTYGSDFPVTSGALKTTHDSDTALVGEVDPFFASYTDAFVTKLNPTGTGLIYSTYLGGNGDDAGRGIKVDSAGNAYVAGMTRARNFPTLNSPQTKLGGFSDGFIAKLNQSGNALIYSTYVGGTSDDAVNAIAIDESGNAYVSGNTASTDLPATAGAFQNATADVSVYKSTNGGASWLPSNVGLPGDVYIGGVIVDPGDSASLYAPVYGRVFKSTDGGRRWESTLGINPGRLPDFEVTFALNKPATVYGISNSFLAVAIVKSVNGGQTWAAINPIFQTPVTNISGVAIDPVSETTIYARANGGLFKSIDGGNWIARGNGLPSNGAGATILAIDPKNPDRLFARTSDGLFSSINGGKKWHANSLGETTILTMTFDPTTASTVYASGAGILKSTDSGDNWQEIENDLPAFGVGRIVVDPSNGLVLYTNARGGVFKSTDGGRHWIAINSGLGQPFLLSNGAYVSLAIDPRNPSVLYARGLASGADAFVGKLNSSGSSFVYLSYLGGTGAENATGVAVDGEGNAYVMGETSSVDFPVARAFQPDKLYPIIDLFVTRLNADGATVSYSTYLGGDALDYSSSIDVDRFGNVYVAGLTSSRDFPLENSLQAFRGGYDGFIARIADPILSRPAPTISGISPASGSSGGLYVVTIQGANFLPGARVRIGGVPVVDVDITANSIRGTVLGWSNDMIQTVDVAVSNPDGQSFVLKKGFTFNPHPQIGHVFIDGTELRVSGSGFDKGSVILLKGKPQTTRLELAGDIRNVVLLSRKAAKKIAPGETVVLQVRNEYGLTSLPFNYTRINGVTD